jgi:hypothetical protein
LFEFGRFGKALDANASLVGIPKQILLFGIINEKYAKMMGGGVASSKPQL